MMKWTKKNVLFVEPTGAVLCQDSTYQPIEIQKKDRFKNTLFHTVLLDGFDQSFLWQPLAKVHWFEKKNFSKNTARAHFSNSPFLFAKIRKNHVQIACVATDPFLQDWFSYLKNKKLLSVGLLCLELARLFEAPTLLFFLTPQGNQRLVYFEDNAVLLSRTFLSPWKSLDEEIALTLRHIERRFHRGAKEIQVLN